MKTDKIPAPGYAAPFLDEEEELTITEIETAVEEGKIRPQTSESLEGLRNEWREVLQETQKRKAVTLRLQERDILRVKSIARELGIPCQTYLASVIHRVATGEISVQRSLSGSLGRRLVIILRPGVDARMWFAGSRKPGFGEKK